MELQWQYQKCSLLDLKKFDDRMKKSLFLREIRPVRESGDTCGAPVFSLVDRLLSEEKIQFHRGTKVMVYNQIKLSKETVEKWGVDKVYDYFDLCCQYFEQTFLDSRIIVARIYHNDEGMFVNIMMLLPIKDGTFVRCSNYWTDKVVHRVAKDLQVFLFDKGFPVSPMNRYKMSYLEMPRRVHRKYGQRIAVPMDKEEEVPAVCQSHDPLGDELMGYRSVIAKVSYLTTILELMSISVKMAETAKNMLKKEARFEGNVQEVKEKEQELDILIRTMKDWMDSHGTEGNS